ncbi:hypothetical protein ACFQZC_38610 [Streptacidiphilus monticola]
MTLHHTPVQQKHRRLGDRHLRRRLPEDAARKALTIHRNPRSTATVFHVTGPDGTTHRVDLQDHAED